MSPRQTLYQKVVLVTYIYLGPAADRFVARQITNHLNKRPEQLRKTDMPELIDWIKLAMSFLTEDQALIQAYVERLHKLDAKPHNIGDRDHATETV